MNRIKIGQIGIGHNHGEAKMSAFRKFPELFEVVGWCEEDEEWVEKRGNLAAYKGLPRLTKAELLDSCEAMLIETDVWRMMPEAKLCVERGIHIHLDKPAGEDYSEYEDIIRTAERNHAIVQLGYMYRYNNAVRYILERVRSGEMGRVLMVDTDMCTEHSLDFRKWLEHFRGGDMYIFGSHLIDLVLLFQGEPTAIHPFLSKTHIGGADSYDSTLAVLEYPYGSSTVRVTSNEPGGWTRRQLVVVCENGSFEVKPFENPTKLWFTPANAGTAYSFYQNEIELPEMTGRYDQMARDFYSYVREGVPNPFGYDYELTLHKWILRACNILR